MQTQEKKKAKHDRRLSANTRRRQDKPTLLGKEAQVIRPPQRRACSKDCTQESMDDRRRGTTERRPGCLQRKGEERKAKGNSFTLSKPMKPLSKEGLLRSEAGGGGGGSGGSGCELNNTSCTDRHNFHENIQSSPKTNN